MEQLQTVQDVFSRRFFRVPDYQRGYSWEPKQWDDLLDDLEVLAPDGEHYTGTLVLHPAEKEARIQDETGDFLDIYNVVDGQQRLTTIVILLDSIRRQLRSFPSKMVLAEGIKKSYVATKDIEGQFRAKLTLNSDTRAFFERNIIGDTPGTAGPKIQSEKRLQQAQLHFQRYFDAQRRKLGDDAFVEGLLAHHKKITGSLKITVYEVKKEADVGVIFEVMNNRGKHLSEMEKVKNYLLYAASKIPLEAAHQLASDINDTWRKILERLMAADVSSSFHEDQLLRGHWIMAYDYRTRNWEGNDSIKTRFSLKEFRDRHSDLLGAIAKYISTLNDFSVVYCDLFNPGHSNAFERFRGDDEMQRRLQVAGVKLQRLEALVSFLPILGAVRMSGLTDGPLCLRVLELCEKYAFRVYRWAEYRGNAGQSTLFRLAHELYHERATADAVLDAMRARLLDYSPNREFDQFLKDRDEDWYAWYGLKYFLYEYEEHLASSQGKQVQLPWAVLAKTDKKQSIEHILPQTPDLPYWKERWTGEQKAWATHDIGNLVLTSDNSSYSNKSFTDKKGAPGKGPCYANSNLCMERQLARYDDWTEAELLARRKEIVEWALTRWRVAPPATSSKVDVPDDDEEKEDDS